MNRAEIERTYAKLDVYEEIADYIKNVYTLAEKRCNKNDDEFIDFYGTYSETSDAEELISHSGGLTGDILASFIVWIHSEISTEIVQLENSLPDICKSDTQGENVNG